MSSKTLEGMARAACDADGCDGDYDKNPPEIREALATDMKRALLWLADNVSDEMTNSADDACDHFCVTDVMRSDDWRRCISAALRAAGDVAP